MGWHRCSTGTPPTGRGTSLPASRPGCHGPRPPAIPWRGESDKQCRRDLGDDEDARGSQRDRSTRGAHRSTVRFHVRHPSSPRCAAWKHASRQVTREEGQQQRRDQKALATSVRGGATEGRARKTDDQESERTLGPRFNEVADELAAIGRATDTSSDELPQAIDRRAVRQVWPCSTSHRGRRARRLAGL